jgi:hypothetical protein
MSLLDDDNDTLVIILIIFLSFILLLVILGIFLQGSVITVFDYLISFIYDFFIRLGGFSSEIINTSGDVVANTSKFGVSLSNNVVHDVGNMVKGQATPHIDNGNELKLDISIQKGPAK